MPKGDPLILDIKFFLTSEWNASLNQFDLYGILVDGLKESMAQCPMDIHANTNYGVGL